MKPALSLTVLAATALVSCAGGMYAPSAGKTSLALTNLTGQAVWYVNVRSCGSQDWGHDILGTGVVTTNETVQRAVPAGCHDIRLRSDPSLHGEVIWSGIELAAGGTAVRSLGGWPQK